MRKSLQKSIDDAYEVLEDEDFGNVSAHLAVTLAGVTVAMKMHRQHDTDYVIVGRMAQTFAFLSSNVRLIGEIEELFRSNRIYLSKDI